MKIIKRIIAFPFIAILSLISALILWIRWMYNYILHGGEFIVYTNKRTPESFVNIIDKLIENEKEI